MLQFQILIGSVNGAAEYAALTLAEQLVEHGHQVEIPNAADTDVLHRQSDAITLIITSTTGNGELPMRLRPLAERLNDEQALPHLRYACAVLGDSSYGDNYCLGGLTLHQHLQQLGAHAITPPLTVDAEETNNPEDFVCEWGIELMSCWRDG